MTDFTARLAGIPIGILAMHATTKSFLKDYLCDEAPAFSVVISKEDLAYERRMSGAQNRYADRDPESNPESSPESNLNRYPDIYLETLAVLRKVADALPEYGTVLFHGAVVAVEGGAYLFTAPSGTGKTTHVKLWLNLLPSAHILNGDKPFLKVTKEGILACGTPWQGRENFGCNEILPLKGICVLERATSNHIEKISFKEALPALLQQVYRPETNMIATLELLGKIGEQVPLYRLRCNMDPEAAQTSIYQMTGLCPRA